MSVIEELPAHVRPGSRMEIGNCLFTKEDILRFAVKWDPQIFHTNEELAKDTLLGGLCASGWHTVSAWMKLQRASIARQTEQLISQGRQVPEFGPSPGMRNIKWIRPVFVGDQVSYTNEIVALRESGSRPGWHIMTSKVFATNQHGEEVMTLNSTVFLRLDTAS